MAILVENANSTTAQTFNVAQQTVIQQQSELPTGSHNDVGQCDSDDIEVEVVQRGNKIVHKIICMERPKLTANDCEGYLSAASSPVLVAFSFDEDEEDENSPEHTFLDAFTHGFLNPCVNQKSILRNKVHTHHVPSHGVPVHEKRSVSFSQLKIAEFDMTLGNHPSSASGPPVMLDWDRRLNEKTVTVDEYESSRQPRRKRKQLKLSGQDRRAILVEVKGLTEQEIHEAWSEAMRIRRQRQETLNRGLILMFFDDVWESTCRKYQKMTESLTSWM